MYRDMGNFKSYGEVIFGNQLNHEVKKIRKKILSMLGGDQIFRASELKLPDLFFKNFPYDAELDHELHEFFKVSETELPANDPAQRDIDDLLLEMEKHLPIV
jgi:hypothetical protein